MGLKIKDLDGQMGEVIAAFAALDKPDIVYRGKGKEVKIVKDSGCIYVEDLGVDIYDACVFKRDPETKEYELESDIFIYYLHGTPKEIYSESGSSLPVSIYNFCKLSGRQSIDTVSKAEELNFKYILHSKTSEMLA